MASRTARAATEVTRLRYVQGAMRIALLHGLTRVRDAMGPLAAHLAAEGHETRTVRYPATAGRLEDHARVVAGALGELGWAPGGDLGFVCHSLGGLVLRALPRVLPDFRCGRSVLIACPLRGSGFARLVSGASWAASVVGPTLPDLVPTRVADLPLVPASAYGVIAGAAAFPPGTDGLVRTRETRLGEADHLTVRRAHFLLPRDPEVHRQTAWFLRHGRFDRAEAFGSRPMEISP